MRLAIITTVAALLAGCTTQPIESLETAFTGSSTTLAFDFVQTQSRGYVEDLDAPAGATRYEATVEVTVKEPTVAPRFRVTIGEPTEDGVSGPSCEVESVADAPGRHAACTLKGELDGRLRVVQVEGTGAMRLDVVLTFS